MTVTATILVIIGLHWYDLLVIFPGSSFIVASDIWNVPLVDITTASELAHAHSAAVNSNVTVYLMTRSFLSVVGRLASSQPVLMNCLCLVSLYTLRRKAHVQRNTSRVRTGDIFNELHAINISYGWAIFH